MVDITHESLGHLRRLFISLPAPDTLTGVYRAEFVGPAWLRALEPPSLALGGLAGWWGKAFDDRGRAINIVVSEGNQRRVLPMTIARGPSLIDGVTGFTLGYPKGAPFPWPWVVDEVRRLDEQTLLCMTLVKSKSLSQLAFPFALHSHS